MKIYKASRVNICMLRYSTLVFWGRDRRAVGEYSLRCSCGYVEHQWSYVAEHLMQSPNYTGMTFGEVGDLVVQRVEELYARKYPYANS